MSSIFIYLDLSDQVTTRIMLKLHYCKRSIHLLLLYSTEDLFGFTIFSFCSAQYIYRVVSKDRCKL